MYKPSKMFDFISFIISFSFTLITIIFVFAIITTIILTSQPEDAFIVKEEYPYVIASNHGKAPYFNTTVDLKYLNGTSFLIEEKPKEAALIKIYFYSLPSIITLLFCSYLLKKVIEDLFVYSKSFNMTQVKYLRIISMVVALYFLFIDVIVQRIYSLWLGDSIFYIDNFHISGLLYAGLIYLLAEVFRYGAFLQESYDTTL